MTFFYINNKINNKCQLNFNNNGNLKSVFKGFR